MGRLRDVSKGTNDSRSSDSIPPPPPPPYKENLDRSQIVLQETRTTTTEVVTTTTQTTTHLFSLPWSRRRIPPTNLAISPRLSLTAGGTEHGLISPISPASSPLLLLEKALPPTPTEVEAISQPEAITVAAQDDPSMETGNPFIWPSSMRVIDNVDSDRLASTPPIQQLHTPTTNALAQAVLGIGLPTVMPRASCSSPLDSSTVAHYPFPTPPPEPRLSLAGIRRAKSSQKMKQPIDGHQLKDHSGETVVRKRERGVSLGPSALLSKVEHAKAQPSEPLPTSVTRRPSFWSRRKTGDVISLPTTPRNTTDQGLQPTLPYIPPLSPFEFDLSISPPESASHHGRHPSLGRSRSARVISASGSNSDSAKTGDVGTHKSDRRLVRPATADTSARPRTQSLFPLPPQVITSSPSPIQTKFPLEQPSRSSISSVTRPPLPRPRSSTNPPILHRLSLNLFSSSSSSASPSGIFGPSISSSPSTSPMASPRPSLQIQKQQTIVPKPQTNTESPEIYLQRLQTAVSKAEIAGVLASSGDPFYTRALQVYMDQFEFFKDPLDVALRKLLMDVGLPGETQQIDRVMEAFAARYSFCNPNLFISDDHPYILAFSLIMLHTDAFNKSNKRKMTKQDYLRNTKLPGITQEVLDCYYDNIVFAPFIFIEDPLDVNGQRGLISEANTRKTSTFAPNYSSPSPNGSGLLGKSNKIDPYYLITNNLLGPLRVDVAAWVPMENPYLHEGTAGPWDEAEIRRSFAKSSVIEVGGVDNHRMASPFFGLSVGGAPGPIMGSVGAFEDVPTSTGEVWTLRVTKVGLLARKDEYAEGGKKVSNRKWKIWSVILTGSQLLLFHNSAWAEALLASSERPEEQVMLPQTSVFKPDELLSVHDAIAVYDKSYDKHENTFRLILADGRQSIFQADQSREMNEWISRVNYASAFKTAGVRMRPIGMTGKQLELTGVAAATSHLHDKQISGTSDFKVRSLNGPGAHELMDMLSTPPTLPLNRSQFGPTRKVTMMSGRSDMEMDAAVSPEVEGAEQFKVTFDLVKAELATGSWRSSSASSSWSPNSALRSYVDSPLPSRVRFIRSKVQDLESKIGVTQSELDTQLRLARNVATLTPFQRSTRERLQSAIQNVSKRVMYSRLEMAKLVCHRDVLLNDLAAEEKEFNMAKEVALTAATDTLRSRDLPATAAIPIEHHDNQHLTVPQDADNDSHRPDSSACESFHSALEFDSEWLVPGPSESHTTVNEESPVIATPVAPTANSSRDSFPDTRSTSFEESLDGAMSLGGRLSHEKYYTALETDEQAEEWDKTRCAKRVSLVRMPSDLRLAVRRAKRRGDSVPST